MITTLVATEADWTRLLLSVTVAVKFAVPLAVGVPVIAPVDAKVNPTGNCPDVTDQA